MKRFFIALLPILVLIILSIGTHFFFIGEPVDAVQLHFSFHQSGDQLTVCFESVESAMALRGVQTQYDGQTVRVTARKVPVTPLFPSGNHILTFNLNEIGQVIFADTVIWIK